jgi:hypothetical protein
LADDIRRPAAQILILKYLSQFTAIPGNLKAWMYNTPWSRQTSKSPSTWATTSARVTPAAYIPTTLGSLGHWSRAWHENVFGQWDGPGKEGLDEQDMGCV